RAVVQHPVAAALQAAREHRALLAVRVEPGDRSAVDAAVAGSFTGVAADRAGKGTDGRADRGADDHGLGDRHLAGVNPAFLEVRLEHLGIDSLQINDGLALSYAAGEQYQGSSRPKRRHRADHVRPLFSPRLYTARGSRAPLGVYAGAFLNAA